MQSLLLSAPESASKQQTVRDAAQMFARLGYYEAYFEDVWKAMESSSKDQTYSGDAYSLALQAFSSSADPITDRLKEKGRRLEDLLGIFERLWPEGDAAGKCVVLNVWADKDRVYPSIADQASSILREWQNILYRAISPSAEGAPEARTLAAHCVSELAGGYRLATAYRNASHFKRAIMRVRKALLAHTS